MKLVQHYYDFSGYELINHHFSWRQISDKQAVRKKYKQEVGCIFTRHEPKCVTQGEIFKFVSSVDNPFLV